MRIFLLCLILFGLGIPAMSGAPIDEAKKLYKNGRYIFFNRLHHNTSLDGDSIANGRT